VEVSEVPQNYYVALMKAFEPIYEDNHLILVNKSAGVLVQGDSTGDAPLSDYVKQYIKKKYNKPGEVFLGVIHRLDRPVTGIVALARTSKALERMNALFRERQTRKIYWALVSKRPPAPTGVLVHWLLKDEKKNKTTAYNTEVPGALQSELSYTLIKESKGLFLIEVHPITGRPHQIRVQLASMGCAIKGDVKYGDKDPNLDGSICLHARRLEFVHPVKKELLNIEAKLPDNEFWNYFSG
jgi:23S rRNA pseudouridine1911/1915/1917 synthase